MLIPAILRKNEILYEFQKLQYTDDLMFEVGNIDNCMPNIVEEPSRYTFQYAIVDKDEKLIGYVAYEIDWYSSHAYNFGLMSFDRGNPLIGKEVFEIMNNLINKLRIHRIAWYMVSGNPVERSYDRFCNKYNGRKIVLKDTFRDRMGNYHDSVAYEIINNLKLESEVGK